MKLKNIYCHKLKYIYHNSGRFKPWGEDEWTQVNVVNLLLLFAFCPAGGDTPPLKTDGVVGGTCMKPIIIIIIRTISITICVQYPAAPVQSPPAVAHRLEADLNGVPLSSDCGDAPDGKPGIQGCVSTMCRPVSCMVVCVIGCLLLFHCA